MEANHMQMITPHLNIIKNGKKAMIYDSVYGNKLIVNHDSLKVLKMLKKGEQLDKILLKYDVPGIDSFIDVLAKNKLIHDPGEIKKPAHQFISDTDLIHSGGLLRQLRLNVTESCNLDCTYCYERESKIFAQRRKMSWEVAKKSIDLFMTLTKKHHRKSIGFRFFGGEPLLNWPLVKKCLEYIKGYGTNNAAVKFTINTNGTILDKEILKVLSHYNVYIALSLDGVKEENDKFRKFKDGRGIFNILDKKINLLVSYKARFGVAVVFYDQNLPHLTSLIDYIKKKQEETNCRISVNFSPLARIDRKDMDRLTASCKVSYLIKAIKYARQQGIQCFGGLSHFPFNKLLFGVQGAFCGGVGSEFSIDPEGSIFPCAGLDIKLGHIDHFMEAFKTSMYNKIVARRTGNLPHCKGCSIEGFCSGGCLADVKFSSGDIYGMCRDCNFQRELFKELVKEYILC